jgi:hypothetical protein
VDINTRFPFPTVKSFLKPAPAGTGASNSSNTGSATPPDVAFITSNAAQKTAQGGCGLTPILLASANGRLNVVRELLWRNCDCRYSYDYHLDRAAHTKLFVLMSSVELYSTFTIVFNITFLQRSVRDADGSTVLHHIARAKQDAEAMLREVKKHQQPALDKMLDAADGNGDPPLLVACDGETSRQCKAKCSPSFCADRVLVEFLLLCVAY